MKTDRTALYQHHAKICAALRKAFERVKHHKQWTKRVRDEFETELPGYTVYITSGGGIYAGEIHVSGNGIAYNDALHVGWTRHNNGEPQTWQEGFTWALDRADPSDSLERMEAEQAHDHAFAKLDEQIKRAKEEAAKLIASLPIPQAAKLRSDAHFWTSPSLDLSERYPDLFKR